MAEIWIPITVGAAFFQNVRSLLQRRLSGEISVTAATAARFLFAIPFAVVYLAAVARAVREPIPSASVSFLLWMMVGGIAQIFGTNALLAALKSNNFAVGTAWSKSETVQAALFGALILGESVSALAAFGIVVSLLGLLVMNLRERTDWRALLASNSARWGLLSGATFAIAAVAFRAATLSVDSPSFLVQAAYTLACVTTFQSLVLLVWLRTREPSQINALFSRWRIAVPVGLTGMLASCGWFSAMALTQAAYVRALGQIELLFTFATTLFVFRERLRANEWLGIAFLVAGILVLLLGV